MRCIITGARGLVGGNLGSIFRDVYGWEVIGTGSSGIDDEAYFRGDITKSEDIIRLAKLIETADIIIHAAAVIDNRRDLADIFSVNVVGSINALDLAKKVGAAHFVNISSIPVIGRILDSPITESHVCKPVTGYHLSKLQAEEAIAFAAGSGIDVVTVRISSPVGKNSPRRTFLPVILDQALKSEPIELTGDSRRRQNYLDLRDLASAIEAISRQSNLQGIYNIAARESTGDRYLADIIISKTLSKSPLIDRMHAGPEYFDDWKVSCEKARKAFGYVSRYNVSNSIEWVVEDCK